jgi:hypothetical protein
MPYSKTSTQSPADLPTPEKRFDNLHASLVEYYERFISVGLSSVGFNLLVIGWVVSSASAQKFFRTHPPAVVLGVIVLSGAALGYVLLSLRICALLDKLKTQLKELNYMPKQYYEFRSPPLWSAATFIAMNAAAAVVAALLLITAGACCGLS